MSDTSTQTDKLQNILEQANRILITSHISPDPDSICSILLLGTTLEENFSNKQIAMHSEELPEGLDFLSSYNKLVTKPLSEALDEAKPDLIIMVDAMNFARCTRGDWQAISNQVATQKTTLVIIDHHEPVGVEDNAVYINEGYPASVEQVYETCFSNLNLEKPPGYAETTMIGLYSDTGGFSYLNDRYSETLALVIDLIKQGVSVEKIKNKLSQYTLDHMRVISELSANVQTDDDYTYAFLGDDFVQKWQDPGKSLSTLNVGTKIFNDHYIRNINGRKWGFITYRDPLLGSDYYSVSLRSLSGVVDVSQIAGQMNGGGHKAAAGGKVQATNIEEALDMIKQVIKDVRAS